MKKVFFIILILSFICSVGLYAEEAPEAKKEAEKKEETIDPEIMLMKNGDRITGVIQKFEDDYLIIESKQLGEIKVPWEDIKGMESVRILYFRMENGNVVAARALGITKEGKQILESPLAGTLNVERKQILMASTSEEGVNPDYLRMQKELKETKEALRKASEIGELWSGFIEASFSGNEGNKNDRTFVLIGHVERKTEVDKFTAHIGIKYSSARREVTDNEVAGYIRESLDITPRIYVYGRLEGEWDEVNDINFRFSAELGFGVHILKENDFQMFEGDKITLDLDIGGHYTGTDFAGDNVDTHNGGVVVRLMYQQIFPNLWKLVVTGEYKQSFQQAEHRKDLGSYGDYRAIGEVRLEIPVTGIMSFTGSIKHEYVNAPAAGKKRNDFYWLFGLRINL